MRLLLGLIIGLSAILAGHSYYGQSEVGYLVGAVGILLGAILYYSSAATSSADAIEYMDTSDGINDIVSDVIRTMALTLGSGAAIQQFVRLILSGGNDTQWYFFEVVVILLIFTYISFWEFKQTVRHTIQAFYMLASPSKMV
jgi:hypothetical protein